MAGSWRLGSPMPLQGAPGPSLKDAGYKFVLIHLVIL